MEQKICVVCTTKVNTNSILLDTRLHEDRFKEQYAVTGWTLCPTCTGKKEQGYVALVGALPPHSGPRQYISLKPEDANRTGEIVHIKKELMLRLFNLPPVPDGEEYPPLLFVEPSVISALMAHMHQAQEDRLNAAKNEH